MIIKETITLDEVLNYININYDGVKEAIKESASRTHTRKDFLEDFEKYFSENGLGGDDCWMDVETYLPLVVNITEDDEKIIKRKNMLEYYKKQIDLARQNLNLLNGYESDTVINNQTHREIPIELAKKETKEYIEKISKLINNLDTNIEELK